MGKRGENIRLRKDGRWEGRFSRTEGDIRRVHSVYAHSYKEAKEKLARAKLENGRQQEAEHASSPQSGNQSEVMLRDAAEGWLSGVPLRHKHSTSMKYRYIYRHYIYEKLGNIPVRRITEHTVEQKLSQGLSPSTVKGICCVLGQIQEYAGVHYRIPVRRQKPPRRHGRAGAVPVLNATEQKRLLKYLSKGMDGEKLGICVCLFTGLRLGEICALRWSDIDPELSVLHVGRSVQRVAGGTGNRRTTLMESSPKTAHSLRDIPLSRKLAALLEQHRGNGTYLLGGEKPTEPRTYQYRFARMLEEAGIAHKNFHVLRHTFATNCISSGADAKSVSELLGHASVALTLNRYVHPTERQKRESVNALEAYWGQEMGQE